MTRKATGRKRSRSHRNPSAQSISSHTPSGSLLSRGRGLGSVVGEFFEHGLRQGVGDLGKGLAQYARQRMVDAGTNALRGLLSMPGGSGPDTEMDPETGTPKWFSRLLKAEFNIFPIIGMMGEGKTTLALSLAETMQKPVYMLDAPPELLRMGKVHRLASLDDAKDVQKVPPGSIILIDDMQRYLGSRKSMSSANIGFQDLVFTIRHFGHTLLATFQDSSSVDKSGIIATAYFLKAPVMGFEEVERPSMVRLFRRALSSFSAYPRDRWKEFVFVHQDDAHEGMLHYSPPDWYTTKIAHYRGQKQGAPGAEDATGSAEIESDAASGMPVPQSGRDYSDVELEPGMSGADSEQGSRSSRTGTQSRRSFKNVDLTMPRL